VAPVHHKKQDPQPYPQKDQRGPDTGSTVFFCQTASVPPRRIDRASSALARLRQA
jgi:hypothetical protein